MVGQLEFGISKYGTQLFPEYPIIPGTGIWDSRIEVSFFEFLELERLRFQVFLETKFKIRNPETSFFEISFHPDPSTSRSFETNSTLPGAIFVSEQKSIVI